jgi:hypothetical protein
MERSWALAVREVRRHRQVEGLEALRIDLGKALRRCFRQALGVTRTLTQCLWDSDWEEVGVVLRHAVLPTPI